MVDKSPRPTPAAKPTPTVNDSTHGSVQSAPSKVARWPLVAGGLTLAGVGIIVLFIASRTPASGTAASAPTHSCPSGMTAIAGGTFRMGSEKEDKEAGEDERPARDVTLSPFCIDTFEVTTAQYRKCTLEKRGDLQCPAVASASGDDFWSKLCNGPRSDHEDHPINCVDWNMASTYCRWAGGDLPTEAQWEYAARGTDRRTYPWGNEPPDTARLNVCGLECLEMMATAGRVGAAMFDKARDNWEATAPVGQFPAGKSPFGVMDMAGNVWEWVKDSKAPYDASQSKDPVQTRGALRVMRGGGWSNDNPVRVRAAGRLDNDMSFRDSILGFRCARGPS